MKDNFDHEFSEEMEYIVYERCLVKAKENNLLLMPKDIVCSILKDHSYFAESLSERFKIEISDILSDISEISVLRSKIIRKSNPSKDTDSATDFVLTSADHLVGKFDHESIEPEHIFYAILTYRAKNAQIVPIRDTFNKYGITEKEFRKTFIMVSSEGATNTTRRAERTKSGEAGGDTNKRKKAIFEKQKKALLSHGYIEDVIERVSKNKEKFIGRSKTISRCIQSLCRKKKKNVIIVGESGVGKTSLVDGIALDIIEKRVPKKFLNTEIYSVNIGNIVAGTKYRGQFEERMKVILQFFEQAQKKDNNVLMFIDEIHMIVHAGASEGSVNAGSLLKPKLSSGEIQCIGTTTPADYKKHILHDDAFSRRFSIVQMDEPQKQEAFSIVDKVKGEYEEHHGVTIEDGVVQSVIDLTDQYIKDRHFPDKAFDIIDEACSRLVLSEEKVLGMNEIEEVISDTAGVPITSIRGEEKDILVSLVKDLNKRVIGQPGAIKSVSESIQRSRVGLKDPDKPIGIYLFLGQTGVGKTHLAKTLSESLFGENKIIRLDMGEYMEKYAVSKIIGSPPGYVGYEEGSVFADEVRKKPYSVILLDEIEKAHKDILNVFLQIFDEGRMTDAFGRLVDFRNTIIIMTSNLATAEIMKHRSLGFASSGKKDDVELQKEIENILMEKVEDYFSPEFINRIDSTVIFKKISEKTALKILDIEIEKSKKRINKIGYDVRFSTAAKKFICKKGYSEKYGARPMARTIQQEVETPLTSLILKEGGGDGKIVYIDVGKKKGFLEFNFEKGEEQK